MVPSAYLSSPVKLAEFGGFRGGFKYPMRHQIDNNEYTQHMNNTTNNDWAVVLSAPSARRLGEAEAGLDDHEISLFRNALVFLLNAPGIGSSGLLPQFEHHSRLYPGSVEAVLAALASASGDEPELSQRVAAAWWQWQQLVADQLREQEEAADHLLAQQLAAEQAEAERQRQQAEAQQLRQQRFPPERLAQQCGYPMHIARDFPAVLRLPDVAMGGGSAGAA